MTETIGATDVVRAIEAACDRIIELREYLTELDAAIGDGDLGINMAKGATALHTYLAENAPDNDLGTYLAGVGMAFNRAAPSTMGTLLATALMRAGKEARGLTELDGPTLARLFEAAGQGMMERGKAQPGDKTILDALLPARDAFADAIAAGQSLADAGAAMLAAARAGRDAVTPLQSKRGRAGWVGERTVGKPDPGAVLFVQMLEAVLGAEHSEPAT
jgi:phosphoenolpyruvate---glycerone phosphotransferase subunit DhaL